MQIENFQFNHIDYGFSFCSAILSEKLHIYVNPRQEITELANSKSIIFILKAFYPSLNISRGKIYLDDIVADFSKRNYYKEIVSRMKAMTRDYCVEKGLSKQDVRFFANSGLPEKFIAFQAGLGFIGQNSLLINKDYGSKFLLGGFVLPFDKDLEHLLYKEGPLESLCGSCDICQKSCPAEAIEKDDLFPKINTGLCYQARMVDVQEIDEKEFLGRDQFIYGCELCQNYCPYNLQKSTPPVYFSTEKGAIPHIDVLEILEKGDLAIEFLEEILKSTNIAKSWISKQALMQNILISTKKLSKILESQKKHLTMPSQIEYIEKLKLNILKYEQSNYDFLKNTALKLKNY